MRKNRVIEQNRCYHLVSQLAYRAFFHDDEEKDRAVALMRRVEAGVQASMSYCINRADPFDPHNIEPRVWKGELETVIGCMGDSAHLDPGLIAALDVVETVQRITRIRSVL